MTEWILMLSLNLLSGVPGEVRDMSLSTIDGFTSKQSCEIAANKLAERAIVLVGKQREREGIASNTRKSSPAINYECVLITK